MHSRTFIRGEITLASKIYTREPRDTADYADNLTRAPLFSPLFFPLREGCCIALYRFSRRYSRVNKAGVRNWWRSYAASLGALMRLMSRSRRVLEREALIRGNSSRQRGF